MLNYEECRAGMTIQVCRHSRNPNSMTSPKRSIYREKALAHYRTAREQIVLPRFASVRWAVVLWVLAVLLLAALIGLITARVPVYASGVAIVLPAPHGTSGSSIGLFLPAKDAERITSGQTAVVHFDGQTRVITQTIVKIDAEVLSPTQARTRYALDASSGQAVNAPSVVARVMLDRTTAAGLEGAIGRVDVQIGTQRAIGLLPGLSALLQDAP